MPNPTRTKNLPDNETQGLSVVYITQSLVNKFSLLSDLEYFYE
tara:strand:+ start:1229 stop:1357 length:129 start_codon:yes stop_codon:yes gene_type:complete